MMGFYYFDYGLIFFTLWTYCFSNMDFFNLYYQLILIPLWPVLCDYKVPIFEVPIMGTFTNSDVHCIRGRKKFATGLSLSPELLFVVGDFGILPHSGMGEFYGKSLRGFETLLCSVVYTLELCCAPR